MKDQRACLEKKNRSWMDQEKEKKEKQISAYPLVSFHELPNYMKHNEYILNYYRSDWPLKLAFLSLFRWHNETLNVWMHLLGLFLFMGLTTTNIVHVPQLVDFIITVFSVV